MTDSLANAFWLTIIDMVVVFLVLYVVALIIKAIKLIVAPFGGNGGPGNGRGKREGDPARDAGEPVALGTVESELPDETEEVNAETTAVISAALAAYLDKPAFVPVALSANARRGESLWAMAGRTRIMQSREMAKRRATA